MSLDFEGATAEFSSFLEKHGYPPNLLWIDLPDVLLGKWRGEWRYFVWNNHPDDRESVVREQVRRADGREVGIAFEAISRTGQHTICRLIVPTDEQDAERRLIPGRRIKYLLADSPIPTILVERKSWWNVLRLLTRKSTGRMTQGNSWL